MQKDRAKLAADLAQKIDKTGKVLHKDSSPVHALLEMELVVGKTKASLRATSSPFSNGSTHVIVKEGRKVLFEATGDMWLRMKVDKDVNPGSWEQVLGL